MEKEHKVIYPKVETILKTVVYNAEPRNKPTFVVSIHSNLRKLSQENKWFVVTFNKIQHYDHNPLPEDILELANLFHSQIYLFSINGIVKETEVLYDALSNKPLFAIDPNQTPETERLKQT